MKCRWLLALVLIGHPAGAEPTLASQSFSLVRADGRRIEFEVEVADSAEQRRVGLMGRVAMPARHGMLFDFGTPTAVSMWMKDTLLSLDMLFIDAAGKVVSIAERTTPGSLELITAPLPVRYVLELNGGEARQLGLAAGDRHSVPGAGQGLESSPETVERQ